MTELSRLIARLQRGISRNASYVKTIRHPQLLLASLQELNDLIGNEKVKDSVATQVSHLIMIKRRAMENSGIKEDEVMLNTVLYGPPGVGKTLIGVKLAKIWYSLGYLDGSKNSKERNKEVGEIIKDMFKDNGLSGSSGMSDETTITLYFMFIFILVFISIISLAWSFYTRFGGMYTLAIVAILMAIVVFVAYFVFGAVSSGNNNININIDSKTCNDGQCNKGSNEGGSGKGKNEVNGIKNKNNSNDYGNSPVLGYIPTDDQVIKVVTRADFVEKFVGWSARQTNKLLEENLGKVLFVDEAYSLINGMHDEFGMEALTALNLFLSQRPKEIIVIFAGYKDLLAAGPFSVQPGLKRRFMWQFDCEGYSYDQLFEIFKMQLKKKGWGLTDDAKTLELFEENVDAFPAYGGDTERAGFFAELEHSRDYIGNENNMKMNLLEPRHILNGINKLRENNIQDEVETSNPMANMMKMFSGRKQNNKPAKKTVIPPENKVIPKYSDHNDVVYSDRSEPGSIDMDMINAIREHSMSTLVH